MLYDCMNGCCFKLLLRFSLRSNAVDLRMDGYMHKYHTTYILHYTLQSIVVCTRIDVYIYTPMQEWNTLISDSDTIIQFYQCRSEKPQKLGAIASCFDRYSESMIEFSTLRTCLLCSAFYKIE